MSNILDKIIIKIKKELNNHDRIDEITKYMIEPIVYKCIQSLYPYFIIFIGILTLLLILLFAILLLSIKICYK